MVFVLQILAAAWKYKISNIKMNYKADHCEKFMEHRGFEN